MRSLIQQVGLLLFLSLSSCSSIDFKNTCHSEKVFLQSPSGDFKISYLKFSNKTEYNKALIIIPPTGGTNYIDRDYAEQFCKKNYTVYIADGWTNELGQSIDLGIHQKFYSNAQKAISMIIEQIKPGASIGLLGTSVGGLHTIIAASVQPQIKTVFAIVAGISIAEVIATSDQSAMLKLRQERLKFYGIKDSVEHIAAIQKNFHLEPQDLPALYKQKKLGVSIALQDTTVRYETQKNLIEFWKPSLILTHSTGHFWGIVNTWLFNNDQIIQFFEENQPQNLSF